MGRNDMSVYDYRCKKCGHEFEIHESIGQHEREPKPPCPKCQSKSVEQIPMVFQAVTAKKA